MKKGSKRYALYAFIGNDEEAGAYLAALKKYAFREKKLFEDFILDAVEYYVREKYATQIPVVKTEYQSGMLPKIRDTKSERAISYDEPEDPQWPRIDRESIPSSKPETSD
jgi:hypothetical protein